MISITKDCIRCKKPFPYKINILDQRGYRTRKYCDDCIILQHRDESREYQKIKRLKL